MKNFAALAFILMSTFSIVKAQNNTITSTNNDVKVKVNVNLNSFQSIEIGSGAQNPEAGYDDVVTLTYASAEDYRNGVSKLVAKQLKVSSVGSGFTLKAKLSNLNAPTTDLTRSGNVGVDKISADEILQIAVGSTGQSLNQGNEINNLQWTLNNESNGQASVLDKELDVKYFGKKINQDRLQAYFNNVKNQQLSYTVDVTYEILPN